MSESIGFCTCYPGDSPERPAPDCGIPSHRVEGRRIRSDTAPPPSAAVPDPADVEKAAQAIRDSNGSPEALAWWRTHPQLIPAHVYAVAALAAARPSPDSEAVDVAHLERQRAWSRQTFGPGDRAKGVVDHIRKELREIEADPTDLGEWVDVVILALDGAWRSGAEPAEIIAAIKAKQARNEARQWPDWRTAPADKAIEHVRAALGTGDREEGR